METDDDYDGYDDDDNNNNRRIAMKVEG